MPPVNTLYTYIYVVPDVLINRPLPHHNFPSRQPSITSLNLVKSNKLNTPPPTNMRTSTIFAVVASALLSSVAALPAPVAEAAPAPSSSDLLSSVGSVVGSTLGSATGNSASADGSGYVRSSDRRCV